MPEILSFQYDQNISRRRVRIRPQLVIPGPFNNIHWKIILEDEGENLKIGLLPLHASHVALPT